jgi:hypothetical protein
MAEENLCTVLTRSRYHLVANACSGALSVNSRVEREEERSQCDKQSGQRRVIVHRRMKSGLGLRLGHKNFWYGCKILSLL